MRASERADKRPLTRALALLAGRRPPKKKHKAIKRVKEREREADQPRNVGEKVLREKKKKKPATSLLLLALFALSGLGWLCIYSL
jgi:hypothetical protein